MSEPRKTKAKVLQDGHIDPITGPRCMIKPNEGRYQGLYLIAHTNEVLKEGQDVLFDHIYKTAVIAPSQPHNTKQPEE